MLIIKISKILSKDELTGSFNKILQFCNILLNNSDKLIVKLDKVILVNIKYIRK